MSLAPPWPRSSVNARAPGGTVSDGLVGCRKRTAGTRRHFARRRTPPYARVLGARAVEQLQQLVSCQLDILVAPLSSSILARD
jgi:hypothetical protein